MTEVIEYAPDSITVGERLRGNINKGAVSALVESIQKIGLQEPIVVRRDGVDDIVLVTGRHRLEAFKEMGLDLIPCVLFEGDFEAAKLWEIAENLHRAELTLDERNAHIAEWVKITAAKVAHCGPPSGGEQPLEQGIRKAAEELKIPRSNVQRAVAAESLSDTVKAAAIAAGMGATKRAKIAKLGTEAEQLAAIEVEANKPRGERTRTRRTSEPLASEPAPPTPTPEPALEPEPIAEKGLDIERINKVFALLSSDNDGEAKAAMNRLTVLLWSGRQEVASLRLVEQQDAERQLDMLIRFAKAEKLCDQLTANLFNNFEDSWRTASLADRAKVRSIVNGKRG